jgi:histidine triad (HIT) family protein
MGNCLFCRLIQGEIPSTKVYESDQVVAFLDINPVNPGHTLVVPKEHYSNLSETPESVLEEMIRVVKKLSIAIMKATNTEGFNLGANNGTVAGQVIFHTHFHVMPRRPDDGLRLWPGKPYKEGEMAKMGAHIQQELKKSSDSRR